MLVVVIGDRVIDRQAVLSPRPLPRREHAYHGRIKTGNCEGHLASDRGLHFRVDAQNEIDFYFHSEL
jgi:hypothetical protein